MLAKTTIESSEAKRRIPGESIFSLGLVGFSVLALYLSIGIPGEASISMPGTLPLVASMVLLLSAIAFSRRVCVQTSYGHIYCEYSDDSLATAREAHRTAKGRGQ